MKKGFTRQTYIRFLIGGVIFLSAFLVFGQSLPGEDFPLAASKGSAENKDSSTTVRYSVKKTTPETYDDLLFESAADLKSPSNVKSEIVYDPETQSYIFKTIIGENEIGSPIVLSSNEYRDYTFKRSMRQFFREKNRDAMGSGAKEFNFLDMQFELGALEKVFGPGGVRVTTQGSAELSFGLKTNNIQNPALPMRSRKKSYFDFDEKIEANVTASVGDKVNFSLNYNTDATIDFDAQKIQLQYKGKEDEIIKNIEAGNVSMTTGSSLIRGGAALFGLKTTMQFGKLTATAVVSQQETESKTINLQGGAQTTPFEIKVDQYDENRHFFLAHYFRDNYDRFMSKLPYISSGVTINRVEVWVTNKRGNYDQSRNIMGFMDLGENKHLGNSYWQPSTGNLYPANNSNNLYSQIINNYPNARYIDQVTQVLEPLSAYGIDGGTDYVKVESARKLDVSEYILNKQLGYISLKSMLNPDEVLAIAFEYTLNGTTYQVGEFSTDITDTNQSLYLKMLKGTTVTTGLPVWDLMMKNVYSLNAYSLQKEKFRLDILYLSDTTGVLLNYLPSSPIKDQLLLRVMNLDRLDSNNETNPDGFFDYVEGYTVIPQLGRIVFPVIEPFGSYLRTKLGGDKSWENYIYQELYDTTKTAAQQMAEKNKYVLKGEYKSSAGSEIRLNAMNVPRGSVRVTAGGMPLVENQDYSVDYYSGTVTILNQSIIEAGTPISVSLENQSMFSMQRKTMVGLDLNYAFSPKFNLGATIMHLSEKPLTEKLNMGNEVLNNTLWGVNASYNTEFQWLTNLVDKIPGVSATVPSKLNLTAEFAQLIPGQGNEGSKKSYVDDFESSQTTIDLRTPYAWNLASTPYDPSGNALFPEARYSNDVRYGMNRSLLSWYYIDRLFTQTNSSLTPSHIKGDLNQLSNHYVREISAQEIFPNKELAYGQSNVLQVLNLSFYPNRRGPYNLDADGMLSNGELAFPEKRWGGIMRRLDNTDFEASNIEYVQFWLLDPYIYDSNSNGGDLYLNFGEVSEDILKDGMKSFENGLPIDDNNSHIDNTVWGHVSKRQSTVYAFDNATGGRVKQDVGLDGLSNKDEFEYGAYKEYIEKVRQKVTPDVLSFMSEDPFSPLNDPAGDNYHFYRGVDFDNQELNILSRYRHYNGVEGNSLSPEEAGDPLYQASKSTPDVEDINQDNTLNEYERYYQYKVSLRPADLQVGTNYITDKRTARVRLRNGNEEEVNWYQFKIPLREYQKKIGSIQDFKTIRFARIFMTGFTKEVHLRLATLELVRGEWRVYTQPLYPSDVPPITNGQLNVSVVNIEENAGQSPVNYVLPPGISRVIDPSQSQITQLNEQAMSMKITELAPADARAVYKNCQMDMRQYKRLQMFTHAEKLIDDVTNLQNKELSVFIRIGSDQRSNYYEYEIPLILTPEGKYNGYNSKDQATVWPSQNMFDFPLSLLTNLKLKRNESKRKGGNIQFTTPYSIYDPEKTENKVTILGNPSLSDIRTITIGVRNNARTVKSAVIWVNELRLSEFDEDGGWAARGNANLSISDLATINIGGHIETPGFGGLDQSLTERRMEQYTQYNIATMVDLGRFLPEKAKVKAPLFYSISEQNISPKYNPLDQDILLSDALEMAATKHEKDSIINFSQDKVTVESFSLSGIRVDIRSKTPMPYDPGNFTIGYSYNRQSKKNPTTSFENSRDYRGNLGYSYSPPIKPWEPFSESKNAFLKDISLNWLPNNIGFNTNISRYYYEQQLRDLNNIQASNNLPVSVQKNFYWDRQFALDWRITKNLSLTFNSGTNARIIEPAGYINKKLHPDRYESWKDSVVQSILELGTPWTYAQTAQAKWNIPINKLSFMDWALLSISYNSSYGWDRGAYIDPELSLGNNINNMGNFQVNGTINFEQIYSKSKYLEEVTKRFSGSPKRPVAKKTFNRKVSLRKDTATIVQHNLDNKKLVVTGILNGKPYSVKYKIIDANKIVITNQDTTAQIALNIVQGQRPEESPVYQSVQYVVRPLMLIRNLTVRYENRNNMFVPSFKPEVGSIFGQKTNNQFMAPGLDFAFGLNGQDYINKIIERDWLIINDSIVTPAVSNRSQTLDLALELEPLPGLQITLTALHNNSQNQQIQFMYAGRPVLRSGSFNMTYLAIGTALAKSSAKDGFNSKAFNEFLINRQIIADRIEGQYQGTSYPNGGFMDETGLAGKPYDPNLTSVGTSSADVLIPAFLAAYGGKSAHKIKLTAIPGFAAMMPNWNVKYNGLSKLSFIRGWAKNISISHGYNCSYNVIDYNSFLGWVGNQGNPGFIRNELTSMPIPSTALNITSVSINEKFNPLLGIDITLLNGLTVRGSYMDTRGLNLNIGAGQLIESTSQEFRAGAGYKIVNFGKMLKIAGANSGSNNDLALQADFSYRRSMSLIRRIEQAFTQATAGSQAITGQFSADYTVSRLVTMRAFYDLQINTPLVSSTSYPVTNSNLGIAIRLSLAR